METQVTFPSGELLLEGLESIPTDSANTGVVLCHPHPLYGGEMHNKVVAALTLACRQAGFATLRFNFRGVGKSEGEHGGGEAERADVRAAIDYLESRQETESLIVAGYSFGAMVGMHVGACDARVDALVAVAPPVERIDATPLIQAAKPTFLISGDTDHVCPLPGLMELADKLPSPKTLVTLPGTDHFLAQREQEAADAAIRFIEELG